MAYCTVEDIEKRFLSIDFTTTTSVTTSDVEAFIELNTAEIDGRLDGIYSVPITGTKSLKIVQKICEFLTIADVHEILDQKNKREKGDISVADGYREKAEQMLEAIEQGSMSLSDAESLASSGFVNYNVDNAIEFTFKKGVRHW